MAKYQVKKILDPMDGSKNSFRGLDTAIFLARPVLLSLPESLVRLVMGEWVDSTLLADYNVIPKVLLDKKYKFRFSDLEAALRHSLKRR